MHLNYAVQYKYRSFSTCLTRSTLNSLLMPYLQHIVEVASNKSNSLSHHLLSHLIYNCYILIPKHITALYTSLSTSQPPRSQNKKQIPISPTLFLLLQPSGRFHSLGQDKHRRHTHTPFTLPLHISQSIRQIIKVVILIERIDRDTLTFSITNPRPPERGGIMPMMTWLFGCTNCNRV